MTIAVAEKSHAVLGPSGWHTWGNCPGSVPLSDGIVSVTSSYAKEGTAAHSLLERCLTEDANAEDFLGEDYEVEGEVFTVNQEMADAVNSSIDIVKSYLDEGAILQVEQTVPLSFMTGEIVEQATIDPRTGMPTGDYAKVGAEGTCDVAILCEGGTHLIVIDFKYGAGVMVYASEHIPETTEMRPNGQLAMYALGWLQKYGMLYEDVTKVTLVVLQPRMEWTDEYTLSVDRLREFESVVREAAGAVEMERLAQQGGDELTLVPGDKQCKFCKAKAICPALKDHVSTSLALVAEPSKLEHFENLTLPKQAAAIDIRPDISNEKLAEFLRAVPMIETAIEAVRAEVERRLFADQQVPGFYLGVGRQGNRAWTDQKAVEEVLRKKRIKVDDIFEKKLISPTSAEKKLKDRPKVWEVLQPHISRAPGKPSVCREGDKNEPYKVVSAPSDFANLDAPLTIAKVVPTRTDNGTYIEASDGKTHCVLTDPAQIKLAKVGEPWSALAIQSEPVADAAMSLEDMLS